MKSSHNSNTFLRKYIINTPSPNSVRNKQKKKIIHQWKVGAGSMIEKSVLFVCKQV